MAGPVSMGPGYNARLPQCIYLGIYLLLQCETETILLRNYLTVSLVGEFLFLVSYHAVQRQIGTRLHYWTLDVESSERKYKVA